MVFVCCNLRLRLSSEGKVNKVAMIFKKQIQVIAVIEKPIAPFFYLARTAEIVNRFNEYCLFPVAIWYKRFSIVGTGAVIVIVSSPQFGIPHNALLCFARCYITWTAVSCTLSIRLSSRDMYHKQLGMKTRIYCWKSYVPQVA